MKIEMSELGQLMVYPETSVEMFALRQWAEKAFVMQEDAARSEQCHWRGSMLIVCGTYKGQAPQ